MQDIHGGILGGGAAASAASSCQIFTDRRLRPHSHHRHQSLKCPRCDSLDTKFCYYNNYNLSQPRHFCKNCRRYWTKGGVLRNVPVGGGCRKSSKRSSTAKPKPSPAAAAAEGVVDQKKPSSRSSSESTVNKCTNETAASKAQSRLNVNLFSGNSSAPIMMINDAGSASSLSPLFKFSDQMPPTTVDGTRWSFDSLIVDHGPAMECGGGGGSIGGGGGIFTELGSLMNLMNASSSEGGNGHQNLLLGLIGGSNHVAGTAPFWLHHQNAADHHQHHHDDHPLVQSHQSAQDWSLAEKIGGGDAAAGILDQMGDGHVDFLQERPGSGGLAGGFDSYFDLTSASATSAPAGGVVVDSHHDGQSGYWGTQTTTSSQWPPEHDNENDQYHLYLPP